MVGIAMVVKDKPDPLPEKKRSVFINCSRVECPIRVYLYRAPFYLLREAFRSDSYANICKIAVDACEREDGYAEKKSVEHSYFLRPDRNGAHQAYESEEVRHAIGQAHRAHG